MKLILSTIFMLLTANLMAQDLQKFSPIEGTWSVETRRGMVYESWKKVNDTLYTGTNYLVRQSDTVLLETIELVKRNNEIYYIVTTQFQNDKQPIPFKLIKTEGDTYTFENPDHDFPQRIIYTIKAGSNDMPARIEGMNKGNPASADFPYKKVN